MSVPHRVAGREEPGGKAEMILAAAERAFLASGFGAVSMDAIAREAGVSKATVYAHFAGKEELFGAVIARCQRAPLWRVLGGSVRSARYRGVADHDRHPVSRLLCSRQMRSRSTASSSARSPAFRCSAKCSGRPARSACGTRSRRSFAAPPQPARSSSPIPPGCRAVRCVGAGRNPSARSISGRGTKRPSGSQRRGGECRRHLPAGLSAKLIAAVSCPAVSND